MHFLDCSYQYQTLHFIHKNTLKGWQFIYVCFDLSILCKVAFICNVWQLQDVGDFGDEMSATTELEPRTKLS
jgi:hypothetical protein